MPVSYSESVIKRRTTRQIKLGSVKVGGDAPITVQSMTKTDTCNVRATVHQIWSLEAAGCDIVRVAVPVRAAAEQLAEIKKKIRIPLVADIHFNYKLALIALEQGVDGLRLKPGNIGVMSRKSSGSPPSARHRFVSASMLGLWKRTYWKKPAAQLSRAWSRAACATSAS